MIDINAIKQALRRYEELQNLTKEQLIEHIIVQEAKQKNDLDECQEECLRL